MSPRLPAGSRSSPTSGNDEERFRELFAATYEHLVRFVERRADPMHAEDVVADVFLVAWRRLDDVPDDLGEARAWLFGIARRTLANRLRGDARQQALVIRLSREADVATPTREAADRPDLSHAWTQLSDSQREVLVLTDIEELTGPQAARVLGITRTALSVRLMRARRALRQQLLTTSGPDHPDPQRVANPKEPKDAYIS